MYFFRAPRRARQSRKKITHPPAPPAANFGEFPRCRRSPPPARTPSLAPLEFAQSRAMKTNSESPRPPRPPGERAVSVYILSLVLLLVLAVIHCVYILS